MGVKIEKFNIITKGFNDVIDITAKTETIIANNDIKNALMTISVLSPCVSIITMESEPGLKDDLTKLLDDIIPLNKLYKHDSLWYEGNAFSHLKASILGNNITIGIENGKLLLGQYQRIILIDFDNKAANRELSATLVY